MMSPQEKAIELYSKYYNRIEHTLSEEYSPHEKDVVKECILVAVDEIIRTLNYDLRDIDVVGNNLLDLIKYWRQVKIEIKKTMTPQEKALELVDKYYMFNHIGNKHAIKCALIAVDEIIPIVEAYEDALSASQRSDEINYWLEVKHELNEL